MVVTMELVLVRHGEAQCNVAGVVGGERGCTGLSPRGEQQVRLLARRLVVEHRTRPFDALYTSPRRRALETTAAISDAIGVKSVVEWDLRHLDPGEADGHSWQDINSTFQGPPQRRPDLAFAPGAESWNTFLTRSTAVLRRIIERHPGERS